MIQRLAGAVFLALLCLLLFFHRLSDRDLWASHEARAAQNAQTILDEDCWGLPRLFDGKPELQKPPLYYWMVAAIAWFRHASVDAWTVRLPAALAGTGGVLLVWFVLRRRGRPLAAFLAGGILATAMHYTWLARTGRIDMPLTLTVGVALAGYYLACGRNSFRGVPEATVTAARSRLRLPAKHALLLLAYLALAAGLLLKGPIAVVLPTAVIVLHLLLERRLPPPWQWRRVLRLVHELGLWWGLPLVLALSLPWFVWVDAETGGEFARTFFWKHNLQRGLGGASELASHPWWFYFPRFTFDFLPWSPLLLLLGWFSFRHGWWRADPDARFGLAWFVAVIGVLSLASFKRADYLLPAYPGAALFLACAVERWCGARRPDQWVWTTGFCAIALAWWFYLGQVLPAREPEREWQRFAAAIRSHAPDRLVLFFRTENHALAFHLGRPVATLLEWENLDIWASSPETIHVVMPPDVARQWPQHLKAGRLEEVLRTTDLTPGMHARPLVLLRSTAARNSDAGTAATSSDWRNAPERPAAGVQRPAPPGRRAGEVDAAPRQAATRL